jgi:hypothetical protein
MTFMKNILKNICNKNKRPGIAGKGSDLLVSIKVNRNSLEDHATALVALSRRA